MPQTKTTLKELFSEILANLAFMFTDDEESEPSDQDVWLETSVRYLGPNRGTLVFHCPRRFTTGLAANLLGVDPEAPQVDNQSEDAVKEFMNILCGQLVTQFFGSQDIYNLSIPQCRVLPEVPEFIAARDPNVASLSVDGSRIQLVHLIEDPAPSPAGA
ncbi:MAG: chemotaxis protein CheX [Phycisphaerae bacterium]|nr:chemotaxis protein CheX [Phycisphaerae bacterium]